jgi:hypothetical protein
MGVMIWNAIPWWVRMGLIGGLMASLGGAYLYVRHQGYEAGYSRAEAECEAEKQAQREANEAAIREAEKDLFRAADALALQNMELEDAIAEIDAASQADPDGGILCLSAASVQRLNEAVQ